MTSLLKFFQHIKKNRLRSTLFINTYIIIYIDYLGAKELDLVTELSDFAKADVQGNIFFPNILFL